MKYTVKTGVVFSARAASGVGGGGPLLSVIAEQKLEEVRQGKNQLSKSESKSNQSRGRSQER